MIAWYELVHNPHCIWYWFCDSFIIPWRNFLFFVSYFVWSDERFALFTPLQGIKNKKKMRKQQQQQLVMVRVVRPLPCFQVRWWTGNFSVIILFMRDGWECIWLERGLGTWCILFKHNNIILNKFGVDLLPYSKLIIFFPSLFRSLFCLRAAFSLKTLFFTQSLLSLSLLFFLNFSTLAHRSNSLNCWTHRHWKVLQNEWKSMRVIFYGGQVARRHHFVHAKCHFKIV